MSSDDIFRKVRPMKTDGFETMINKDHRGAKEKEDEVIASFIREYNGTNALDVARAILKWLREGDPIE